MGDKVLFLFLGWLLGLLAPAISDAIKRRRETAQVRRALVAELHEVRYRIALAGYYAQMRFGTIDRSYLQWLVKIVDGYRGSNPKEKLLKSLQMQLQLTDQQIEVLVQTDKAKPEAGLNLKKYLVPLLDSRVASLWFFDADFQNKLLEIRAHLNLLNEEVEQARYYFGLTFSKLDEENHSRAVTNLEESYRQYASRARIIANRIGDVGAQ